MHKLKNKQLIITALCTVFSIICILINPVSSAQAAKNALIMCGEIIIPSIFPFMIIALIFSKSGLATLCGKYLNKFMKCLFGISGSCATAFVLGSLSGFPVGAKVISKLYQSKECSKEDAEKSLIICNNAGPAFVIGTVGGILLNSRVLGLILWIIQIFSSLLTGVIFNFKKNKKKNEINYNKLQNNNTSLIKNIVEAVTESSESIVTVCGFIIFFAVIISMIKMSGLSDKLCYIIHYLTKIDNNYINAFLTGIIEMTSGVKESCILTQIGFILTSAILSWTGLSVQMQIYSCVLGTGISMKPYFYGRIIQTVISSLTAYLVYCVFKESELFSHFTIVSEFRLDFRWILSFIIITFVCVLFLLIFFLNKLDKH